MRYIVAGDGLTRVIGHAGAMVPPSSAAGTLPSPRDPQQPYRIGVVCLGNICRSPMAEVVLRTQLEDAGLNGRVELDSAGTGDWHAGEAMDSRARAELTRRGFDGSGHTARQIQASWLARYDLLLAMDRSNVAGLRQLAAGNDELTGRIRLLRSFDPESPSGAEVPDPYYGRQEDYAEVFDLVDAAARGLVSQLAAEL
jgi:protein-tyrosine phosphatase